ncbi:MAG: DUF3467 domain-containing protein [Candidatus Diapherotrites archaeon]|nr:DUF3467 domain-containing protein [Candidatus Diapherotrites archaeon]
MEQPKKQKAVKEIGGSAKIALNPNSFTASHSQNEFLIELGQMLPDQTGIAEFRMYVFSRLIMNPQIMKNFTKMINDNMEKYEEKFGKISDDPNQKHEIEGIEEIKKKSKKSQSTYIH